MGAKNFQDLIVWQKAMDLVDRVYRASKAFPQDERYGPTQQMRRAAVSIPSNIAEGQGRQSKKEFARFLSIAHGSLRELETQILIAQRLEYLKKTDDLLDLAAEVGRLINGLAKSLNRSSRGQ